LTESTVYSGISIEVIVEDLSDNADFKQIFSNAWAVKIILTFFALFFLSLHLGGGAGAVGRCSLSSRFYPNI
jgi:hypothetical protein